MINHQAERILERRRQNELYRNHHQKQYSHMTVMDEKGKVIKTSKVGDFRCEVEGFLEVLGPEMGAVIEAGHSGYTMIDVLEELGVKVRIAHPLQVKP